VPYHIVPGPGPGRNADNAETRGRLRPPNSLFSGAAQVPGGVAGGGRSAGLPLAAMTDLPRPGAVIKKSNLLGIAMVKVAVAAFRQSYWNELATASGSTIPRGQAAAARPGASRAAAAGGRVRALSGRDQSCEPRQDAAMSRRRATSLTVVRAFFACAL
jgi:hypothetical protein